MGGCIIIIWASTWLLKITSIETLRETAPPWRLCLLSNEHVDQSLSQNTSVSVLGYDRIPLEYSFSAVSWIFLAAIRRVLDNVLTILMVHKVQAYVLCVAERTAFTTVAYRSDRHSSNRAETHNPVEQAVALPGEDSTRPHMLLLPPSRRV